MKKEKTIITPELTITGNIMLWEDTAIQLSNISSISTVPLALQPFPLWTLLVALVGLVFWDEAIMMALISLAIAVGVIIFWYSKNEVRKTQKNLVILMNSGVTFSLLFYKKDFLEQVFGVLSSIIAENGKSVHNIKVNIENSTIDNSSILNNLSK